MLRRNVGLQLGLVILGACLFFIFSPSSAIAVTTNWIGPSGGSWNNAANWDNGIPTSSDDVVFPAGGGTLNISLPSGLSTVVNSLTIQNASVTLQVSGSGTQFTTTDNTISNLGTINAVNGGTLNISGKTMTGTGGRVTASTNGTVNANFATINQGLQFFGGTITGTILAGTGTIQANTVSANNAITVSSSYTGSINAANVSGLTLSVSGFVSGPLFPGTAATINIQPGTSLGSTFSTSGAGAIKLNGATATILGGTNNNSNAKGLNILSGNTTTQSGTTTNVNSRTIEIDNGGSLIVNGIIANASTAILRTHGDLNINGTVRGGFILVESDGSVNLQNGGVIGFTTGTTPTSMTLNGDLIATGTNTIDTLTINSSTGGNIDISGITNVENTSISNVDVTLQSTGSMNITGTSNSFNSAPIYGADTPNQISVGNNSSVSFVNGNLNDVQFNFSPTNSFITAAGNTAFNNITLDGGTVTVNTGGTVTTNGTTFKPGSTFKMNDASTWTITSTGVTYEIGSKISLGSRYDFTFSDLFTSTLSDTFLSDQLTVSEADTIWGGFDILNTTGWAFSHTEDYPNAEYDLVFQSTPLENSAILAKLSLGYTIGIYQDDQFHSGSYDSGTGKLTVQFMTNFSNFAVGFEAPVPEPATIFLLLLPLAGLARRRRRI